jgi:hypothetical protein
MPELLTALDAFMQENRRSGEMDGGVEGGRVSMVCAAIVGGCAP